MVYVLNADGKPLMPTERYGKVRKLLKNKEAKVIRRTPFTIQLIKERENNVQPVSLGIDAGSGHVGLSATTKEKVLFEAELQLRNTPKDSVTKKLTDRAMYRRSRRNRKTRYRPARFDNRVHSKKKGWLAPTIRHKIDCHLAMVDKIHKILPVSSITAETASFDTQKIKNPDISGVEYQQGDQMGFWNVRDFVLYRDGHKCQHCKGKSGDKILNVHHINQRKDCGSDSPDNLITLCETCHKAYHKGKIKLNPKIFENLEKKTEMALKDAAHMTTMRKFFFQKLKELYSDVHMTFGYITKNTRIRNELEKSHCVDARCISGNPLAEYDGEYYYIKKNRCHNRSLHEANFSKGGERKSARVDYIVHGFRMHDVVEFEGKIGFVSGRIKSSGQIVIKHLDGTKITARTYKKIRLVAPARHYSVEKMKG